MCEKDILRKYIKALFNCTEISRDIEKQISNYVTQGISEKDIYNALYYWYTIKENDVSKANNRIGIVPYILEQSKEYIEFLKGIRKQHNDNKSIVSEQKSVSIKRPDTNVDIQLFDI